MCPVAAEHGCKDADVHDNLRARVGSCRAGAWTRAFRWPSCTGTAPGERRGVPWWRWGRGKAGAVGNRCASTADVVHIVGMLGLEKRSRDSPSDTGTVCKCAVMMSCKQDILAMSCGSVAGQHCTWKLAECALLKPPRPAGPQPPALSPVPATPHPAPGPAVCLVLYTLPWPPCNVAKQPAFHTHYQEPCTSPIPHSHMHGWPQSYLSHLPSPMTRITVSTCFMHSSLASTCFALRLALCIALGPSPCPSPAPNGHVLNTTPSLFPSAPRCPTWTPPWRWCTCWPASPTARRARSRPASCWRRWAAQGRDSRTGCWWTARRWGCSACGLNEARRRGTGACSGGSYCSASVAACATEQHGDSNEWGVGVKGEGGQRAGGETQCWSGGTMHRTLVSWVGGRKQQESDRFERHTAQLVAIPCGPGETAGWPMDGWRGHYEAVSAGAGGPEAVGGVLMAVGGRTAADSAHEENEACDLRAVMLICAASSQRVPFSPQRRTHRPSAAA